MSDKKKIYKPNAISGFPEWTPDVRYVEQQWLDHIRKTFESYGFCNIETPAVEELDVISAKGEDVDKEIYVLERLQADEDEKKEARLALHFDQTVPLARYTAQHFNDLVFPFKRYQMQKVWRGERPQKGRFREFYQCDIDVINVDHLPLHFDAEMPAIIWEILSSLPGMENEKIQIRVSNRKILMGYLNSIGIVDQSHILKITSAVDKLAKQGKQWVTQEVLTVLNRYDSAGRLRDENNKPATAMSIADIDSDIIENVSNFIDATERKYTTADELEEALVGNEYFDTSNPMLKEGVEELQFVMDQLSHLPEGAVVADLSIVRGLDYYTGTVYETVFLDDPSYGSICSGGRYDDLASNYINKKLPGVGISIGFSRLFDRIRQKGKLPTGRHSAADIFMIMPGDDERADANATAKILRDNGYNVEVAHGGKIKKQLATAEKKAIPYVWFPFSDGHKVKNMSTGDQVDGDAQNWRSDESS